MGRLIVLILLALKPAQEDPARTARVLIEKLGSEDIAVREAAAQKLKAMGKVAFAELELATKDKDPEVRVRAARLMRVITLLGSLSPNLRASMPGIEERLAEGDEHSWTEAFLDAVQREKGKRRYPSVNSDDLDPLVTKALQAARNVDERRSICRAVSLYRLPAASSNLLAMVKGGDPVFREAAEALADIKHREAVPALIERARAEMLKEPGPWGFQRREEPLDHWAVRSLVKLRAREAIPDLIEMLNDTRTRDLGAVLLGELGAKEAIPEIRRILKDDKHSLAAKALARLGAKEAVPDLIARLEDPHSSMSRFHRRQLVRSLGDLDTREALPPLVKVLKDPQWFWYAPMQAEAVQAIGRLGAKEAIPDLIQLLDRELAWTSGPLVLALARLGATEAKPTALAHIKVSNELYGTEGFEALAALGIPETVSAVREAIRERELRGKPLRGGSRAAAGAFLCRMGSREGVPLVVGDFNGLDSLNAIRMPEAWNRLCAMRSTKAREGWADELLVDWAKDAGTSFEGLTSPSNGPVFRWSWIPAGRSFLEVLEGALGINFEEPGGFEFILEPDRIRVLPRREAFKFWSAWWQSEQEKQK